MVAPARKSQGDRVFIIRVEFRARVGTRHTGTARWGRKKKPETSGIVVRESDSAVALAPAERVQQQNVLGPKGVGSTKSVNTVTRCSGSQKARK